MSTIADPPTITAGTTVTETLERYPGTRTVMAKYGIDMCCGGKHDLQTAARAHGADLDTLLSELQAAARAAS